jgi:hypothetical protein
MRTETNSGGRLWSLAVAALGLVLASCASIDAKSSRYVGAPRFAPTDPAKVEVLRIEPTRLHHRLGEIVLDVSTEPAPPVSDLEARLRREAAKMGADAVVVVYDRIQPMATFVTGGYWDRSIETITGRKLISVAIKYRT